MFRGAEKYTGTPYIRASILLLLLVSGLYVTKLLQPLDRIIYDTQIRFSDRTPQDDIVLVTIDLPALDKFGRWPWPRDIHADFLKKTEQAGAKAIVMDFLFSESSNPQDDAYLAKMIAQNGRVVLPVAPESGRGVSGLTTNLPMDMFLKGAAGIGHVDRELDLDAISRRTYLYAGLSGSVYWPSIALAAMQVARHEPSLPVQQIRSGNPQPDSTPHSWVRSEEYLLPYAGKPGAFEQISYADVLADDFDLDRLAGKYVLVGVTAIGLGDVVSTPVSGESNPMPGIEVIGNEIDALSRGLMISQTGFWPGLVISCILVLCSYYLWGFLAPRYSLFCGALLIALIILLDSWLLHRFRIWFPPATMIIGVSLGYLGWVWGRLVETVKYLNSELTRLGTAATSMYESGRQDANQAFEFLVNMAGFYGGAIIDERGNTLFEWAGRNSCADQSTPSPSGIGTISEIIPRKGGDWRVNLQIDQDRIVAEDARQVAGQLTKYYAADDKQTSRTPVEFINSRIELVRAAHSRLYFLSEFITEVLDQLHVGVIVTDTFGSILMANRGAGLFLGIGQQAVQHSSILEVLDVLEFKDNPNWQDIFSRVMFGADDFSAEVSAGSEWQLLLEVTRYTGHDDSISGMVFNIIDVTTLKQTERSRRDLLAFLSHDLRSPLASLIATSDLARLRPEYRDSGNFIDSIRNNAGRALQMADDFLALMRAENISAEMFKPVDLVQVARDSTLAVESQASSKQIAIVHDFGLAPVKPVYVNGDRSILDRVLTNLLTNAVKYSRPQRMVEVGLAVIDDEAHCWVKDYGYGISAENRQKVFDRFERVRQENSTDEAGVGLGLAFVRLSVQRHLGRIELESTPGEGSCFHVYLPLLADEIITAGKHTSNRVLNRQ